MTGEVVTIDYNNKQYTMVFPNVGQTLDIERFKMNLAGGGNTYNGLMSMNTKTAQYTLNIIDSIAYFSVLSPEFQSDFKNLNPDNMPYKDGLLLEVQYKKYSKWHAETLSSIEKEVKEAQQTLPKLGNK